MKPSNQWLAAALLAAAGIAGSAAGASAAGPADTHERVVIAGGDLTEIAWALGAEEWIVGVDTTSTWPKAATELPQIGYVRRLSAEGVLSLKPDLLIAAADSGPDIALDRLRAAGVTVEIAPEVEQASEIPKKITFVGKALDLPEKAAALIDKFNREMAATREKVGDPAERPKVLFILSLQGGAPLVGGEGTTAAQMIALAGGRNAVSAFEGYKPMSREAIIAAAPDVILMMRQHAEQSGGIEAMLARPEIALTPAGQAGRGITMDGMLLLGFSLRTPQAIAELAGMLHPTAAKGAKP